jgi:hypothetical protein
MTAAKARIIVFGMWFGAMTLLVFAIIATIVVRPSLGLTFNDAFKLATLMTSVYLPVLTAFGIFWFTPGNSPDGRELRDDKWIAALALTGFYQAVMILCVIVMLCTSGGPEAEEALYDSMSGLVHFVAVFSPLATAPVAYMLGVEKIEPATKGIAPEAPVVTGGGQG